MTPTDKQTLWNAISKLNNKPYIGSGYEAYNDVKNPALRGGLYNWKYRDMRELFNELVKYCELGQYEATWRVLQKYKTKIYPAYLRKIFQSLNCSITPPPVCPAIGDSWHGGTVFFIDGNDYYVVSSVDFDNGNFVGCSNFGFVGTQSQVTESYNNTLLLSVAPCGGGNLAAEVLLPITENGYNDWFVPSIFALQAIYDLRLGLLPQQLIWSSTEVDSDNMFIFDGRFGVAQSWPKGDSTIWAKLIRKETCI
jgi:hypothetical protein